MTQQTPPGRLLASGRDADVFELGDGRVLRRFRARQGAEREAAVMAYALEHGYPAPRVFSVSPTDLVMERAEGPTMLADLVRRPWMLARRARTLAALHRRLHRLAAPEWLPSSFGSGDRLLHLDLHPDNVILTRRGPVVIDWTNAARGEPAADVAYTWLIMATSEVPGSVYQRFVGQVLRRLFLRCFLAPFDRPALVAQLPTVARHRLHDRNLLDSEGGAIRQFLDRETGSDDAPPG